METPQGEKEDRQAVRTIEWCGSAANQRKLLVRS